MRLRLIAVGVLLVVAAVASAMQINTGAPGPNTVTGSTSTTFNGLLKGNGSNVTAFAGYSCPSGYVAHKIAADGSLTCIAQSGSGSMTAAQIVASLQAAFPGLTYMVSGGSASGAGLVPDTTTQATINALTAAGASTVLWRDTTGMASNTTVTITGQGAVGGIGSLVVATTGGSASVTVNLTPQGAKAAIGSLSINGMMSASVTLTGQGSAAGIGSLLATAPLVYTQNWDAATNGVTTYDSWSGTANTYGTASVSNSVSHSASNSFNLHSGDGIHLGLADVQRSFPCATGTITWWQYDSTGSDSVKPVLYIDSVSTTANLISGTEGYGTWKQYSAPVTAGRHTIEWTLQSFGRDSYLDDIAIPVAGSDASTSLTGNGAAAGAGALATSTVSVLFSDTFTDLSNWVQWQTSPLPTISSGRMYFGTGSPTVVAEHSFGSAKALPLTFQYDVQYTVAGDGDVRLYLQNSGSSSLTSNCYLIMPNIGAGTVAIKKYVAGTLTTLASSAFSPGTSNHTYKITISSGGLITVYMDGTSIVSATDTSFTSFNMMDLLATSSGTYVDNLTVTSP